MLQLKPVLAEDTLLSGIPRALDLIIFQGSRSQRSLASWSDPSLQPYPQHQDLAISESGLVGSEESGLACPYYILQLVRQSDRLL